MDKERLFPICMIITTLTSALGIYEIIRFLWEKAELAEFGVAVVSMVDTVIAFLLTVIIVIALFTLEVLAIQEM